MSIYDNLNDKSSTADIDAVIATLRSDVAAMETRAADIEKEIAAAWGSDKVEALSLEGARLTVNIKGATGVFKRLGELRHAAAQREALAAYKEARKEFVKAETSSNESDTALAAIYEQAQKTYEDDDLLQRQVDAARYAANAARSECDRLGVDSELLEKVDQKSPIPPYTTLANEARTVLSPNKPQLVYLRS